MNELKSPSTSSNRRPQPKLSDPTRWPAPQSPAHEKGSSTFEFLSALTLGLMVSSMVIWATWLVCLKVHLANVAAQSASQLAHDVLLARHEGRIANEGLIKDWSRKTLALFPLAKSGAREGFGSRVRFEGSTEPTSDSRVVLHLCLPENRIFQAELKPTALSARESPRRDCLGQWAEGQGPGAWIRADAVHHAHASHKIYLDGLSGTPRSEDRHDIIRRVLEAYGESP